jgi:hypothetical protein
MYLEFNNPELKHAFQDVINDTYSTICIGWRVWIVLIELRMIIQFFLNINPYFWPVYYLWITTDLAYNFGRKFYPKFIGFDTCFIVNFSLIIRIEHQLDRLAHGIDKYNSMKLTNKPYKPYADPISEPKHGDVPRADFGKLPWWQPNKHLDGDSNISQNTPDIPAELKTLFSWLYLEDPNFSTSEGLFCRYFRFMTEEMPPGGCVVVGHPPWDVFFG